MWKPTKIRLFIKPWCGWCQEAVEWLQERNIEFEELDVTSDGAAFKEMISLTGQSKAPCIEIDGEILADFDVGQLEKFWNRLEKKAEG
jgi:glutaredoxin 3